MSDVQWVMASSVAPSLADGSGRSVELLVYRDDSGGYAGPWKWSCGGAENDARGSIALGRGYLSPGDARTAAEAWLATYRAYNELLSSEEAGEPS